MQKCIYTAGKGTNLEPTLNWEKTSQLCAEAMMRNKNHMEDIWAYEKNILRVNIVVPVETAWSFQQLGVIILLLPIMIVHEGN